MLEKLWFNIKHNKALFYLNKLTSLGMAGGLAVFTLLIRIQYDQFEEVCPEENYFFIFWMIFVYYSFQCLDELMEIY